LSRGIRGHPGANEETKSINETINSGCSGHAGVCGASHNSLPNLEDSWVQRWQAVWDARKKSLDAAPDPVNPNLFHRIKALSPARFKAARPVRNDSIIGKRKEIAENGIFFPQLFID
jgi:hypothetical protein